MNFGLRNTSIRPELSIIKLSAVVLQNAHSLEQRAQNPAEKSGSKMGIMFSVMVCFGPNRIDLVLFWTRGGGRGSEIGGYGSVNILKTTPTPIKTAHKA